MQQSKDDTPSQQTNTVIGYTPPDVAVGANQDELNKVLKKKKTTRKIFSIVGLILGLAGGLFIGAFIQFGACFKSECSPLEQGAPILVPAATLLITVPQVKKAFKD